MWTDKQSDRHDESILNLRVAFCHLAFKLISEFVYNMNTFTDYIISTLAMIYTQTAGLEYR